MIPGSEKQLGLVWEQQSQEKKLDSGLVSNRGRDALVLSREVTLDHSKNLAKYVERGRESPALLGIVWDSFVWKFSADDVVAKKTNAHRSYRNELTFANRETSSKGSSRQSAESRTPMRQPFLDFARANIRLSAENSSPNITILRKRMAVLSILEKVLRDSNGVADPTKLGVLHFETAESMLTAEFAERTAYKLAQTLADIGATIDTSRIGAQIIRYSSRLKRPNDGDELTSQGQTIGAEKMISAEALNALATISFNPQSQRDRLISRILDLFLCGGFRAGEVLTLPVDCWVEEESARVRVNEKNGAPVSNCGIRYAAKKNREFEIKWLPHAAVPLARRAVEELTELCRPAREAARWLDENPGRIFQFRELDPSDEITIKAAKQLVGVTDSQFVKTNGIPTFRRGLSLFAKVAAIETALRRRYERAPLFTLANGRQQFLADSLVVIFENSLHQDRGELPFAPRVLTYAQFQSTVCLDASQLRERSKKGVARYDLLANKIGRDGTQLFITTHQFRHWLNTLAANEGVSDLDLSMWMGRKDLKQNEAYKHLKSASRTALAREMILDGRALGAVSRIAAEIHDPVERRNFVESRIQSAHVTPFGMCLHNYAAAPCQRHLQCLSGATGRGCPEFLRTKGSEDERAELLSLKKETSDSLEKANAAFGMSYGASNWVKAHQGTLSGINAALAVDDQPEIPNGTAVRVFLDGEFPFK